MKNTFRPFLEKNYKDFIAEPLKIGFTNSFPEDATKVIDKMIFEKDGHKVEVRLTKLTFGPDNDHSVTGIVTDRLEIDRSKKPLGGFGQHGYIEEAEIMQLAAIDMAYKHNLMVCNNICSWPIVKITVQEPNQAHIRSVKQEEEENLKLEFNNIKK